MVVELQMYPGAKARSTLMEDTAQYLPHKSTFLQIKVTDNNIIKLVLYLYY